jgi:hypothetical protein
MLLAPRFWRCFAGYFGLDDGAMRRWWEALCASRMPLAETWRLAILTCDEIEAPSRDAVRMFLLLKVPASDIITLIEALVDEGQLSKRRASSLEEHVLRHAQANGTWK